MANSRIRIDPISMIFLLLLMVWNILIIIPYHSSLPISSTSSQPFYKAIRERLFIPKTFPTNLFKSNFRRSLFSSSSPSSLNENDELLLNTMKDRLLLIKPILFQRSIPSSPEQTILAKNSIENDRIIKRMNCISGLPGGDCENFFLGSESLGQDFLRPGGRNPGKR
ncbi:hypothetical protein SSS_04745 [Sarcoptes scabiei]|nr:hypothetical protein SSS_04745 [Sarcoptes scabiei]